MWAEKLLAADSTCYDAYFALGAENYLLGIRPMLTRWVLELSGARANSEEGERQLRITAEKGHYLEAVCEAIARRRGPAELRHIHRQDSAGRADGRSFQTIHSIRMNCRNCRRR